jgi:hypothetical protein
MWTGLFLHRISLCKQSDGLYMSQDPCINRKYSSLIQKWHKPIHRSIPKLTYIHWTPTCFGQQCCWPKHVRFHRMWANFIILLCTCLCYCSIQRVMNFVPKSTADIMNDWVTVSFQTKLSSVSHSLTFRCPVRVCLDSFYAATLIYQVVLPAFV